MMGPDETLSEEDAIDGEWGDDEAEVQIGARFEDLTEADQRLITTSENREAFDVKAPVTLPQTSRAQSVRGLPKVKSGAFPRLLT